MSDAVEEHELQQRSLSIPANLHEESSHEETSKDGRPVNRIGGRTEVNRALRAMHVIFITISGILGAGLYTGSGEMLKYAGPGVVIICFVCVGVLAVLVMRCIGEMVCIWPIPNALVQFVDAFLDPELATLIGLAYAFAYMIGFQTLIAAAAAEGEYFFGNPAKPSVGQIMALNFAPQFVIFIINCLPVQVYGFLEIVGGLVKILFILVVIVFEGMINGGYRGRPKIGSMNFSSSNEVFQHASGIDNEGFAFFMSLALCAWSFLGVEIPAVLATEATLKVERNTAPGQQRKLANAALKFSVQTLPFVTALVYLAAGTLASLDVRWDDPSLPGPAWILSRSHLSNMENQSGNGRTLASVFVIIGKEADPGWGLDTMLTAFFVITAWSSANTALYVSSRTVYGLTVGLAPRPGHQYDTPQSRTSLWFGWLAYTSSFNVPFNAIWVSWLLWLWIPYIRYGLDTSAASLVLSTFQQLAAVSGVIVWACECWAFRRFRKYVQRHEADLSLNSDLWYLLRSSNMPDSKYPWRPGGQFVLSKVALIGCIIVILASTTSVWNPVLWKHGGAAAATFIGGCGPTIVLPLVWVIWKWFKHGTDWESWRLTRLEFYLVDFFPKIETLHTQRNDAIASYEQQRQQKEKRDVRSSC